MPSSRNALATSRNFMRMFPRLVRAGTTLPRSIVRPSGSASRSSNPCRRPNSCGKSGCAINVEGRSFLLLRLCGPDQEIADHWGLQHVAQPVITVWLQVRVLPGPPRTPALTEISLGVGRTGQRLRFASDRDQSSNWCPVPIWGCSRAMTVGQNGAMSAAGAQYRDQTAPAISCRGRQAPADPSMLPELEWLNRADARLSSPRALFGAWPSARHRPCRTGSPRSAESGFETDGPCGTDCRSRPAIGRQLRFSSP